MDNFLDIAKKAIKEKSSNYQFYQKVVNEVYEYYVSKDTNYDKVKGQSLIFKKLYISDDKNSYYNIANEFNIDVKTLYRYRLEFNKLAIKIAENLKIVEFIVVK